MVETCEEIDKNMAQLTNFQTTRFANSVRFVVINIREDFEALVECLVKIQNQLRNSSANKDQEKFRDAGRLLNAIKNKKFCMTLSGLTDIYNQFGCFVNIVQKVDILPHERYDAAMKVLDKMVKMKDKISCHNQTGTCVWPNYHKDSATMVQPGTYQNVKIERDRDTRAYQTRLAVVGQMAEVEKDPLKQAEDNLKILITRLENDLRKEVFTEESVTIIEKIRFLTDLRSLATDLVDKGHIHVGATKEEQFLSNVRSITATLDDVPNSTIKENYRLFLKKLEDYLKRKDLKAVTSLGILRDLISSDLKLYGGIQLTVQALLCASIKVSVESVVESLVSRYENHFHKNRGLKEENALDEMEIAENGPSEFRADKLLINAMDRYWKNETKSGQWHFTRTSQQHLSDYCFPSGKATMQRLSQPSKYPIMDN